MNEFRAWDTFNNKYFENTYEAHEGNLEILQIGLNGRLQLITYHERLDESCFPGRFILEKYTGIKDTKGNKIYEGDIVIADDNIFEHKRRFVGVIKIGEYEQDGSGSEYRHSDVIGIYLDTEYIKCEAGMMFKESLEDIKDYEETMSILEINKPEIIGNIRVKKELLEGSNARL